MLLTSAAPYRSAHPWRTRAASAGAIAFACVLLACTTDADALAVRTAAGGGAWVQADTVPAPGVFSGNDHRVAALRAGPDGTLHALFLDDRTSDGLPDRLYHAFFDGAAWSVPAPLDAHAARTEAPQLVVERGGRAHAFWYEAAGDAPDGPLVELVHRVWTDGRWSTGELLERAEAGKGLAAFLAAVVDTAAGTLHLLHAGRAGPMAHRTFDGTAWTVPHAVPQMEGLSPALAAGTNGGLALAEISGVRHPLSRGASSMGNTRIRRFQDGGWTVGVSVAANPAEHSHDPQVAYDAKGVLHVVWLQGENGDLFPTRLRHSYSRNGLAWSQPRDLATAVPGRIFYSPALAVDRRGVVHLTFARFRTGMADPRHFHMSFDGERWSGTREILPAAGPRDSELETAIDSSGRLAGVWKGPSGRYQTAYFEPAP